VSKLQLSFIYKIIKGIYSTSRQMM